MTHSPINVHLVNEPNLSESANIELSSSQSSDDDLHISRIEAHSKARSLSCVVEHYLSSVPLARSISMFATESVQLESLHTLTDLRKATIILEKVGYNRTLRILGLLTLFGISIAFLPSVYRFVEQGIWLSNPVPGTVKHPEQEVLSSHAISAMVWSIMCTIQVISGSFMVNHDQQWFGRRFHIYVGRYIWPLLMLAFLMTALWILFYESSENRIHISIIILNVMSCFMIVFWAALGYYFVYTKQYQRHKDCMICVFVAAFVPGLLRLVRYVFQLVYYMKHNEYCVDVNPLPYLLIMAMLFLLIIVVSLRKRLTRSEPHNLLFTCGILLPIIFPMLTMTDDFNPCHWVNVPTSDFEIVIG
eukprot:187703_1